jgi:hypothetical protein
VIVEQLRIIGVTESGVGFTSQLRLSRHLAKKANNGEPADATQRRKPNVLFLREKHETKPLSKLLHLAGTGELFCLWFLLGQAVEQAKPPDQVGRVEADDRPAWEALVQDAQRLS